MKNFVKGLVKTALIFAGIMLMVVPAMADSYNAYPNTGQYVYNQTGIGGTRMPAGSVLQIIYAAGGTIHAPAPDGSPTGGDALIDSTARTVGNIGGAGYFYYALNGLTNGNRVYIRVWNASTITVATHYGDSTILTVNNPLPAAPTAWALASFATTTLKPVPTPTIAISPDPVTQGWSNTAFTITGTNTHFAAGSTLNLGAGITVIGVPTIASATSITFRADVSSSAALGSRAISVTTGAETANGTLTVNAGPVPSVVLNPTSADQGTSGVTVAVTGTNTHFAAGSTNVAFSGAGVTLVAGSINVTSPTALTFRADVAAGAAVGARTVTVATGAENPTATFTVNLAGTASILITPTSANPDTADTLVTVTGTNTHFAAGSTNVAFSGAGVSLVPGSINVTDPTHMTFHVAVASGATAGARTLTVTSGAEIATTNFSVNGGTPPTSVVIDDMEGTIVPPSGYYQFGPNPAANPVTTRVNGAGQFHGGAYGINTTYSTNTDGWRGWGATRAATADVSATDTISFWMKGDGSTTNKIKIQFKDADGTNVAMADSAAFSLSDTTWKQYSIARTPVNFSRIGTEGDATMDWSKVTQYQFVFTGSAASVGVLIDDVTATAGGVIVTPTIVSLSPVSGPAGTAVIINGSNFGTSGEVHFSRAGMGTYSLRSSDTSTVRSYSAGRIDFTSPQLQAGVWNVTVFTGGAESNIATFEVTASTAAADPYNYPNPFNPYRGNTTTIVFAPQGATAVSINIYDITAKPVQKLAWTAGGATEIVWDGKNAYGEIVGDGVYLYRVVDGSKLLGKGKILVINQ